MDLSHRIKERETEGNFNLYPDFPKKNLLIELSNCCNYNCIFCAHKKMTRKVGFMDFSTLEKILRDCYSLGSREVGFYTTGEPLVYKNIFDAISLAKSIGYNYVYITTNGSLCTREVAEKLISAGLDSIKFSINSLDRECYKFIHGQDKFDEVLSNLKYIYDLKIKKGLSLKVYVSYIATKYTDKTTSEIKKFFENTCDECMVVNVRNQSGLTPENILFLGDMRDSDKIKAKRDLPCHYVFNSVIFTYEGYMTACCCDFQNYLAFADINKVSIADAWHNEIITELRRQHLSKNLENNLCKNCIFNLETIPDPIDSSLSTKIDESFFDTSEAKERIKQYLSASPVPTLFDLELKFLKLEHDLRLFDLTYFGNHFWGYCRYYIFDHIQKAYYNTNPTNFGYGRDFENSNEFDFSKIDKLGQQDILVVNNPRRIMHGEKYITTHSDYICEMLSEKYKTLVIEEPYYVENRFSKLSHSTPPYYENIYYSDEIENYCAKKLQNFIDSDEKNCEKLKFFIKNIIKHFAAEFPFADDNKLAEIILQKIVYLKNAKPIFTSMIEKFNPKAVLLFYSPSHTKLLICEICKEKHIVTIELQHGIYTTLTPMFYQVYDKSRSYETFPDYIFTFGRNSIKTEYYPENLTKNIIPTGNFYLEKRFNELKLLPKNDKKMILFISQKTIGEVLAAKALELSKLLESKTEYMIYFKLHPFELDKQFPELEKRANVTVIRDLTHDAYYYQKLSYMQVGVYSTALYEGLKFGLPTIIIDDLFGAEGAIETLSNIGGVTMVHDINELAEIILSENLKFPSEEDTVKLWEPDPQKNILENLRKILNGQP